MLYTMLSNLCTPYFACQHYKVRTYLLINCFHILTVHALVWCKLQNFVSYQCVYLVYMLQLLHVSCGWFVPCYCKAMYGVIILIYSYTQLLWILFLCSHKTSEAESVMTSDLHITIIKIYTYLSCSYIMSLYNYTLIVKSIATFYIYITLAVHGSLYIFKPINVYYVFLSFVIILTYYYKQDFYCVVIT